MVPRPRTAQDLDSRRTRGIQSYRCRVCRGIHPLRKCKRFQKLSAEKRLRAVLINKYCSNCLAHQHSGGTCRSTDGCKTCGGDHHTLLHMHEELPPRPSSPRPPASRPRPERTARQPRQPVSRTPRPAHAAKEPARPAAPTPSPSVAAYLQQKVVHILPTACVLLGDLRDGGHDRPVHGGQQY